MKPIICVNTFPFGQCGRKPVDVLEATGAEIRYNTRGRLRPEEVWDHSNEATAIVAGTEPYSLSVINYCPKLKVIARVGVGFDSVELEACRERGIAVTYTPDAPSLGVAELTIGLIVDLLRGITRTHCDIGRWNRYMGTLVSENVIGVLGVGRIGKHVIRLLRPFRPKVLACDIRPDYTFGGEYGVEWVGLEELFARSNLVTVHVPLDSSTMDLVNLHRLPGPAGAYLINTSRGPVVNEYSVQMALDSGRLAGFAADVFIQEPYTGELRNRRDCVLTAHIGASARRSRFLMELGAAEDCAAVLAGRPPRNPVPQ